MSLVLSLDARAWSALRIMTLGEVGNATGRK